MKAILYIVEVNGKTKFGITTDWIKEEQEYRKFHGDVPIQLLMRSDFDHYWQAELVEQIMKQQLKPFIVPGLHEWLNEKFPQKNIFDCFKDVIAILENTYNKYEFIHKKGNHRGEFYKRAYDTIKSNLRKVE